MSRHKRSAKPLSQAAVPEFLLSKLRPPVADGTQGRIGLLGHRVDLPATGAGADYEVVVQRGDVPHVEDDDVLGFVVAGGPGSEACPVERGGKGGCRHFTHGSGNQETSF